MEGTSESLPPLPIGALGCRRLVLVLLLAAFALVSAHSAPVAAENRRFQTPTQRIIQVTDQTLGVPSAPATAPFQFVSLTIDLVSGPTFDSLCGIVYLVPGFNATGVGEPRGTARVSPTRVRSDLETRDRGNVTVYIRDCSGIGESNRVNVTLLTPAGGTPTATVPAGLTPTPVVPEVSPLWLFGSGLLLLGGLACYGRRRRGGVA